MDELNRGGTIATYRMPDGISDEDVIAWYDTHMPRGKDFKGLVWLEALPPDGSFGWDWYWCSGPAESVDIEFAEDDGRGASVTIARQAVSDGGCEGTQSVAASPSQRPPEDHVYVVALAKRLRSEPALDLDEFQSLCMAAEAIGAVGGIEALEQAGATVENLARGKGLAGLGGSPGALDRSFLSIVRNCGISTVDLFVDALGNEGFTAETQACLRRTLDEETLSQYFADSLSKSSVDVPSEVLDAVVACA